MTRNGIRDFVRGWALLGTLLAAACLAPAQPATSPSGADATPGDELPAMPTGLDLIAREQPTGDGLVKTERELGWAWEVYAGLYGGTRLRYYTEQTRKLLARHNKDFSKDQWESYYDTLAKAMYERDPKLREAAELEQQVVITQIGDRLLNLVPPVAAYDAPNDSGGKLIVAWRPVRGAKGYVVERRFDTAEEVAHRDEWKTLTRIPLAGTAFHYIDKEHVHVDGQYSYRVSVIGKDDARSVIGDKGGLIVKATARRNWVNTARLPFLGFMLVICGSVIIYIALAQRGVNLSIRKIAGLEAVDEAVGRATEMGRPILFVPGIQDMDNIQTVAGLTVLGRVARVAADQDSILDVPTSKSLVMTAARETVHASYINAARPDAFDEKRIYYVTDEQFGYVAALTGKIVREKPATCFYMGAFFAESLILAETANAAGAIQIAGTAEPAQLPFFVAACDYTLIGEEFFAASAYLSGEPRQLGSLKGQDVGKLLVGVLVLVGALLATMCTALDMDFAWPGDVKDYIVNEMLTFPSGE